MSQERKWAIGQEVSRPKVEPYSIVRLVGKAGNIHISSTGKYHVYWHKDMSDEQSTLVHHGGPQGFANLKAVQHQHEWVILRYTGLTIQLPLDQTGDPVSGFTFPELIGSMEVEFPGEQKILGRWVETMQKASRDLPQIRSHGQLSVIREGLAGVGTELSRAINPYKKKAAAQLKTGLQGSKGELLLGLSRAQFLLLKRAQQTVSIVVGTMHRYNALEKLQVEWNGIVNRLPFMAAEVVHKLQTPSLIDDGSLDRTIRAYILNETTGFAARLGQLQGEPYFSKAKEFIALLHPVTNHWERKDYQAMLQVLTSQAVELEVWKRRVREESTGVDFGKYNLG